MKYQIETMAAFHIMAKAGVFHVETCFAEIPPFWQEYYQQGNGKIACGQFGICLDGKADGTFRYAIGNMCSVEKHGNDVIYHIFNCPDRTEIPAGFELLEIPANTWMKVDCPGPLPQSIQGTYPKIEKEWPAEWKRTSCMNIEEYGYCQTEEDTQKPDYQCYIWIPVVRA